MGRIVIKLNETTEEQAKKAIINALSKDVYEAKHNIKHLIRRNENGETVWRSGGSKVKPEYAANLMYDSLEDWATAEEIIDSLQNKQNNSKKKGYESLFYNVVHKGNLIKNNKIIVGDPRIKCYEKGNFSIQIFGEPINPYDAESPFFLCRNLVASVDCTYVGKDRKVILPTSYLSAASAEMIDNNFELVVVNNVAIDVESDDLDNVIKSIYPIINYEIEKQFGISEDIVLYMYVSPEHKDLFTKNLKNDKDIIIK